MAGEAAFSTKLVLSLAAIGLLSFAGSVYFVAQDDEATARTAGANAFSYSAIGHRALVEMLRRADIPVLVSRNSSAAKAGHSALLVVAEPRWGRSVDDTSDAVLGADNILLVLPKWHGSPDDANPRWLERAAPLPRAEVEETLRQVIPGALVRRATGPIAWQAGPFGVGPTLATPQFVVAEALTPLISSEQGILLGELLIGERRMWILSDPDILSNHGLGLGDNAALTKRLIDDLRPPGGAVIFDETIHGFQQSLSLLRAMFELPFVVPTIMFLAAAIVLLWAAGERFGAPIPSLRSLRPGKTALIDNTSSLLRYGGHDREILRRYQSVVIQDVARRLHAPRDLDEAALVAWLDRAGAARGLQTSLRVLRRDAEAGTAATDAERSSQALAAHALYRWKQEMIDGSGGGRHTQPTAQGTGQEDDRRSGRRP